MWDQLVEALTLAYNGLPHRSTGVAPLELVNPMGVSSWVFKDRTRTRKYPLTAQCGTAAEERARAALLTLLVPLIPQMTAILNATQGSCMREHDTSLALPAERLIVEGCAWQRDHAKVGCAGRTLTLSRASPIAWSPARAHGPPGRAWRVAPQERGGRRPRLGQCRLLSCPEYRAESGPLLPQAGGRRPAVLRGPHLGSRDVARWDPPGPCLLDRVPAPQLHGRHGSATSDVAHLSAPRRTLGVASHVCLSDAGGPMPRSSRRRRSRGCRRRTAPGRPCLTAWVGAAAGCGEGGLASFGCVGPSGRSDQRKRSGGAARRRQYGPCSL